MWTEDNKFGWEGVVAIATLTALDLLGIQRNRGIEQGLSTLGKLPILKQLWAGPCGFMQITLKSRTTRNCSDKAVEEVHTSVDW